MRSSTWTTCRARRTACRRRAWQPRTRVSPGWSAIAKSQLAAGFPREVETDRLLLRQFRQDDFDAYAAMVGDPAINEFLHHGPMPPEEAWRHMAMHAGHWSLLGFGRWAVELKQTGEFVGRVGLWWPQGWPEVELGWVIVHRHWGNGYATEAAAAGLRAGFETLGLTHACSLILPGNQRSVRVAEKLGGRYERRIPMLGEEVLAYGYDGPRP